MSYQPGDFQALKSPMRQCALVGSYMFQFALLESAVNAVIEKILSTDDLKVLILTRNMGFAEKVNAMRSLAHSYWPAEREALNSLSNRLMRHAEQRNVIAHTVFGPSEGTDGVEFLHIKAKRKLEFPSMDWSVESFISVLTELEGLGEELQGIRERGVAVTQALAADEWETLLAGIFEDSRQLGQDYLDNGA